VPANRSAYESARGDRTGVLLTRVPFPAKTSPAAPSAIAQATRLALLPPLLRQLTGDFVTAVLAQIAPADGLTIVNCGHHPPLLRDHGDLQPLTDAKPTLPLGPVGNCQNSGTHDS
jgi:stage II sporulation SpoE-like protein